MLSCSRANESESGCGDDVNCACTHCPSQLCSTERFGPRSTRLRIRLPGTDEVLFWTRSPLKKTCEQTSEVNYQDAVGRAIGCPDRDLSCNTRYCVFYVSPQLCSISNRCLFPQHEEYVRPIHIIMNSSFGC